MNMTQEQLQAALAALMAENARLKAQASKQPEYGFKRTQKGELMYSFPKTHKRWPVTLDGPAWVELVQDIKAGKFDAAVKTLGIKL